MRLLQRRQELLSLKKDADFAAAGAQGAQQQIGLLQRLGELEHAKHTQQA